MRAQARLTPPLLLSLAISALGQDGAWSVGISGNWDDPVNWWGGTIPSGAANTAYFTNTIPGNVTVTLPANPVEIGRLVFWTNAPPTATPRTWTFTGGVFTNLSRIEMPWPVNNNNAVVIGSRIESVAPGYSLTILGSTSNAVGEIWLTASNAYSGPTYIGNIARVVVTSPFALGDTAFPTIISNGAAVKLTNNVEIAEPFVIMGNGNAQWTGAIDSLANSTNALLALITLGSGGSRLGASSGSAALVIRGGVTGNVGLALQASGLIIVTNNPITIGNNQLSIHSGGRTVFAVGSNWATTVEIAHGNTVVLGVDHAFTNLSVLRLGTTATGFKGTLNMNGKTLVVGQLTHASGIQNASVCAITSDAPAVLVVNQSANTTVTNLFRGPVHLVKGMAGALWLAGTNDLSAGILVTGGVLRVGHPELVEAVRVPLAIPVTNQAWYEVRAPSLLVSANTFVGGGTNRAWGTEGVLRLSADSPDFTGVWEVRTGALWASSSYALGAHNTGAVFGNYQGGPYGSCAIWLSGNIGITGKLAVVSGGGFTNITTTIPNAGDFTNTVPLGPGAIRSLSGTNVWAGNVEMAGGAGSSSFSSDAGAGLIIDGVVYASLASRILYLEGDGVGVMRGVISNGATVNLPIVMRGTGMWTIAATNQAGGNTTISSGTLRIGEGGTVGNLAAGSVANNGTLIFDRSDTYVVPNTISGSGALIQAGPGTTVLTANNTYTGPTTVSNGTLRVDGNYTGGGLITVEGGTLAGTGSVGPVTVNNGGTLAPGASPGILTANGTVTLNSGAIFNVELNGLAAGTQYDQLDMNANTLWLNNPTLTASVGFVPSLGDYFDIVTDLSGFNPATHGTFAGLPDGATFTSGTTLLQINYQSDRIRLTVVPEPSTLGMVALALGAVLLRRRLR